MPQDQPHTASEESHSDLHDRLMDASLRELLGGQRPPDLTARILAAAAAPTAGAAAVADDRSTLPAPALRAANARRHWLALSVAASLLFMLGIGVGAFLPALRPVAQVVYQPPAMKQPSPSGHRGANEVAVVLDDSKSMSSSDKALPSDLTTDDIPFEIQKDQGEASKVVTRGLPPGKGQWAYTVVKPVYEKGGRKPNFTVGKPIHETKSRDGDSKFVPHQRIGLPQMIDDGYARTRAGLYDIQKPAALGGGEQTESERGRGPGEGGDRYRRIVENAYLDALNNPLSTFSIDVDTASYSNVRQFPLQQGVLPPPEDGRPFASHIEVADCPWQPKHKLVRVAIKGREIAPEKRPQANLVFLIDVSGSMNEPQKLPLLVQAIKLLTEQLRKDDRVAIVVYAGSSGLVLPSTSGDSREAILTALENLQAGGSTNGGAGIELAYKVAKDNHIAGGINRVILCTDGDFNVGVTSDSSLERVIEEKAKQGTFLTVLGFGRGNFNDSMLEALSGKGNGNYAYVDNIAEARKVLVEQLSGTLMTIAKDVKIQIEFNPAKVAGYRLLGYEDRILAAEDFNNDKTDAGEIGSGHTVTALYEIVPAGEKVPATKVDELKYQKPKKILNGEEANELLTLKIRYKEPTADVSQLIEVPVGDEGKKFAAASSDFQFAAAVAGFGMLLRDSQYKGTLTYDAVLEIAAQHKGEDLSGYRKELLELIRKAKQIAGK